MFMFTLLLLISIPMTIVSAIYDNMCDKEHYALIGLTQVLCVMNCVLEHKEFQLILHDIFVYVILYALLVTNCHGLKIFGTIIASAMVFTRLLFGRCIFLWWNTCRNIDYDILVSVMIVINILRESPVLNMYICISAAMFSHFLRDSDQNSRITTCLESIKSNWRRR